MKKSIGIITAIMMMLIISSMVALMFSVLTTNIDSSVYDLKSHQAFFIAESGAQYAAGKILSDSGYRASPTALTGNIAGGSFSVAVTKDGSSYAINSTGTKEQTQRQVAQTITITTTTSLPAAFDYALALLNPSSLSIGGSATIDGDVYFGGTNTLTIAKTSTVDGVVYAENVAGVTEDQAASMPDPLPAMPTLDTSSYDSLIATASGMASSSLTVNNKDTYNVSGTVYYTSLTLKNGGAITGSGTIVLTGNTDLQGGTVASGINIVSGGTFSTTGQAEVGSDSDLSSVVYGKMGVSLSGGAEIYGSVIAPSDKTAVIGGSGTTKVTGIAYGGTVSFGGNAEVTGSIVANAYSGSSLTGSVAITYDSSFLPSTIPTGFTGETEVSITTSNWGESY